MNADEKWQHEMNVMLKVFENQSETSLREIDRCFEVLGRSFNAEFRQYFLKLSTQRYQS